MTLSQMAPKYLMDVLVEVPTGRQDPSIMFFVVHSCCKVKFGRTVGPSHCAVRGAAELEPQVSGSVHPEGAAGPSVWMSSSAV